MLQFDALNIARDYAAAIRRFMNTRAIYLFGPHAQGDAEDGTDIDVAVVVEDMPREYTDQDIQQVMWSMAMSYSADIDPVLLLEDATDPAFLHELEEKGITL